MFQKLLEWCQIYHLSYQKSASAVGNLSLIVDKTVNRIIYYTCILQIIAALLTFCELVTIWLSLYGLDYSTT